MKFDIDKEKRKRNRTNAYCLLIGLDAEEFESNMWFCSGNHPKLLQIN